MFCISHLYNAGHFQGVSQDHCLGHVALLQDTNAGTCRHVLVPGHGEEGSLILVPIPGQEVGPTHQGDGIKGVVGQGVFRHCLTGNVTKETG